MQNEKGTLMVKKLTILLLFTLFSTAYAASSESESFGTQDLMNSCSYTILALSDPKATTDEAGQIKSAICLAYIRGVVDTLATLTIAAHKNSHNACYDKWLKQKFVFGDVLKQIFSYLTLHPQLQKLSPDMAVGVAYSALYPADKC